MDNVVAGNCPTTDDVPVNDAEACRTGSAPVLTISTRTRTRSPPSRIKLLFSSNTIALKRRLEEEGRPTAAIAAEVAAADAAAADAGTGAWAVPDDGGAS